MKQSSIFPRILLLGLILMLVLVACEQPTPGAEVEQTKEAEAAVSEPTAVSPAETTQEPPPAVATEVPVDPAATTAPDGSTDENTPEAVAPENPTPEGTAPENSGGDSTDNTDSNTGGSDGSTSTPVPSGGTYTVSAGENLFRIGLNHGCTTDQMAAANGIAPPYIIYIGQTLVIPNCQ